MLLQLRDETNRAGAVTDPAGWAAYSFGARHASFWRAGLRLLPIASALPHPLKSGWTEFREMPQRVGEGFRDWWHREGSNSQVSIAFEPGSQDSEAQSLNPEPTLALWDEFQSRLEGLGGKMVASANLDLAAQVCFIDGDVSGFESVTRTDDVWQADVGVTSALFAIAETGSLVLAAGPGRARLASLAPPVHVALVNEIVVTLEEAFARIGDRTHVVITGTSRTADIEGVLVRGVHGPRELIVLRRD
jgi:hypothetical protein